MKTIKEEDYEITEHYKGFVFLLDEQEVTFHYAFHLDNHDHPLDGRLFVQYWVDASPKNRYGYAGYALMTDLEETGKFNRSISLVQEFRNQHLENWKEDYFYNAVNYSGIKIN